MNSSLARAWVKFVLVIPRGLVVGLMLAVGAMSACGSDDTPDQNMPAGDDDDGQLGAGGDGGGAGAGGDEDELLVDVVAASPPEIGEIGALPDALSVPDDKSSEELAAYLVAVTKSWSSDALPAYEAALLRAGYTIKNGDEVLLTPEAPNGIAIQAWDVQASKALLDRGMSSSLTDLAEALNGVIDEVELDLTASFIDAIASAKTSGDPNLEFWADLLIALGRQADVPHDWTTLASGEGVQLSPPEILLLFTRMAADVLSWSLRDAAPAPRELGDIDRVRQAQSSGSPCQLTNEQQLILDVNAAGMGKAFDLLAEHAGLGKYTEFTGLANLVMIYVKLAWSFLAFDAEIQFTKDPQKLVRTKTTTAGERKTLQVVAKFDTGNAQVMNCVRGALNVAGLDFSLPSDGPIQGAKVQWKLLRGGTVGGTHPQFGYLEFVGSDPLNGQTDDSGLAKIDVQGARQRVKIKSDAKQYVRRAKVYAGLVIKPANIFQDFTDAISTANFSGLSTLLATPAEMFYRTSEVFGQSWAFPVVDWSLGTLRWEETASLGWSDAESDSSGSINWVIEGSYQDSRTWEVTDGSASLLFGNLQGVLWLQLSDVSFSEHVKYDISDSRSECSERANESTQVDIVAEGLDSDAIVEPDVLVNAKQLLSIQGEGGLNYAMEFSLLGLQLTGTKVYTTATDLECTAESTTETASSFSRLIEGAVGGVYEGAFQGHEEYSGTRQPAYHAALTGYEPEYETHAVLDWDFAIPVHAP